MEWYFKVLANRPTCILIFVATISVACIVTSFTAKRLPDFSDPTLGFEARGTVLGNRITAWRHIVDESRWSNGKLAINPYQNFEIKPTVLSRRDEILAALKALQEKRTTPPPEQHYHHRVKQNKKKPPQLKANWMLSEAIAKQRDTSKQYEVDNELPDDDYATDGVWIQNGTRKEETEWAYGRNVSYHPDDEKAKKSQQMRRDNWEKLKKLEPPDYTSDINAFSRGYFCESPSPGYSHFIMERINYNVNESLFELNGLLAMCDLEQRLITTEPYEELCVRQAATSNCCRPWSIPNYVALLANRTDCFDITAEDVDAAAALLTTCFPYYNNFKLGGECVRFECKNVPVECTSFNAVYNIFHFLADSQFMTVNETNLFLRQAVLFLPLAKSTMILPYYHSLSKTPMQNDLINIPAMDMGLKYALFDECLITDGWWILASGLFVLLCMCLYTSSLCITLMTIVAIFFALGISYFIYTFIYRLPFFPFMNILAVIVIIGIGADDAFIFIKMWQCAIAERATATAFPSTSPPATAAQPRATIIRASTASTLPTGFCGQLWRRLMRSDRPVAATEPIASTSHGLAASRVSITSDTVGGASNLTHLLAYTLRSAGVSMLVTSLTTAAAFYASVFSSITAVRCFGIFAGTAVLVNYILMMTWLPATVSLGERLTCWKGTSLCMKCFQGCLPRLRAYADRAEKAIIRVIMCVPWFWVTLFGSLGILSAIVVFYWPGLQLPTTAEFNLFVGEHPFERYDGEYKKHFWFDKKLSSDTFQLPLRFVWGVQPVDRGDYFNPNNRGRLVMDDTFNMSAKDSQEWLLKFCKRIRRQPFYQRNNLQGIVSNCFIENFYDYMKQRCYDGMEERDREPCCETAKRPYAPAIFEHCLPLSILSIYTTPSNYHIPGSAGPKFRPIDNKTRGLTSTYVPVGSAYSRKAIALPAPTKVIAIVIEFESIQNSKMAYTENREFVNQVENWFQEELNGAPPQMQNGFFISELDFYDLQNTLSEGTWFAVCVSMVIALVVLFAVTLNVLISLYAIITVTFTICSTVAILVLMGWELNVLESVAVSTIIGLAVDFSLHYGVHYGLAPDRSRTAATRFSLSRMIGPTSMAALTTAAAGAFMLPSMVLAYVQIGIFLIVVMITSWLYSTFFLMSLLYVLGPQHLFGQFHFRRDVRRRRGRNSGGMGGGIGSKPNDNNSPNNPVSEQLLSMSSSDAGEAIRSECHEMEPLTSESVVKPAELECNRPINFDRAFRRNTVPMDSHASTSGTVIFPDDS